MNCVPDRVYVGAAWMVNDGEGAAAELGNELALFLGEDDGRAFPRATIGRCHMDDTLVCLYNRPFLTDERLQFLV